VVEIMSPINILGRRIDTNLRRYTIYVSTHAVAGIRMLVTDKIDIYMDRPKSVVRVIRGVA